MKIFKYIFLVAVVSVFFTSCTSDEALNEIEAMEQQATTDEDADDAPDCPDEVND